MQRNPAEVFLIEGHTDAVGNDVDNLSLSDRRAESVAVVLTNQFGVPPENLTSQGYGKQFLKIPTPAPERANRRVAVRRITPLLTAQAQTLNAPYGGRPMRRPFLLLSFRREATRDPACLSRFSGAVTRLVRIPGSRGHAPRRRASTASASSCAGRACAAAAR